MLPLLAGADEAGRPVPEVVVAEELPDGAVGLGDLADHPVGGRPVLAPAAVFGRAEQGDEPGVLEQLDLGVRGGARLVAGGGVGGEEGGDLGRAADPRLGAVGGRESLPLGGRCGAAC